MTAPADRTLCTEGHVCAGCACNRCYLCMQSTYQFSSLDRSTMTNIADNSWRLWVHLISTYVVSIHTYKASTACMPLPWLSLFPKCCAEPQPCMVLLCTLLLVSFAMTSLRPGEGLQGLKRPNLGWQPAHAVLQLLWRYNREAVALRIQYLMTAKMGQESHTVLVRMVSDLEQPTIP